MNSEISPTIQDELAPLLGQSFTEAQLLLDDQFIMSYIENGKAEFLQDDDTALYLRNDSGAILLGTDQITEVVKVKKGYQLKLENNLHVDILI